MQERGNVPSCVKRPARRAMPDRGSPRCSRLLILAMANIYSFSNVPAATGLRPGSGRVRSPRGAASVGSADVAAVELIGGLIVAGMDRLLVPEWNSQARCIGRCTRDMAGACGDAVREGPECARRGRVGSAHSYRFIATKSGAPDGRAMCWFFAAARAGRAAAGASSATDSANNSTRAHPASGVAGGLLTGCLGLDEFGDLDRRFEFSGLGEIVECRRGAR